MATHLLDIGGVHRFEFAHLAEEDVDVDDVREVRTNRLQHHLKGVKDLAGLRLNLRTGQFAGRRIDARGAADRDETSDLGDML
jgi:hypothetical protein